MPRDRPSAPRPPLDEAALERLALHYVGRYATSRARLQRYLARKLAERGWAGEAPPDTSSLAARLAALGYVDDRELAGAKARSLARSGYGARRLSAALGALGISSEDAEDALAGAIKTGWESALRYAERRRIGPFVTAPADDAARRRAFAAMIRAGHRIDDVRRIVSADPGIVPERDG